MKRRNTPAKQKILAVFKDSGFALSQDMLEQKMNGEMDRVTIYRILNSFCEDGILHRVASDDGKNYFALCTACDHQEHNHNHFHFRCLSCEKVECLHEEVRLNLPKGYRFENMNCWVSGYCSSCNV
jgi:Fur family ferric uptake transcriptional regulator